MEHLKISYEAVAALRPNPWNTNRITDPANEKKLEESLKRFGFTRPLVVRTLESGELEILGGEHRWRAAQKLGHTRVPVVNLGPIDDKRAKEIGLVDNGRYGEDDTLGLAQLLKELGSDILTVMPYSESELDSIVNASSVALDDLDRLDRDAPPPSLSDIKPPPASQVMRFKIPVEDVAWISTAVEQEIKNGRYTEEDSLTNAGHALVSLLKRLDKAQREGLV